MTKGWFNESKRHALASKGIKTGRKVTDIHKALNIVPPKQATGVTEAFKDKLLAEPSVESYQFKDDYVIQIFQDESVDSPREWDNLGTFLAFHSRYTLGDVEESNEIDPDQFSNFDEMESFLRKEKGAVVVLPVYMLDHSGITVSTSSFGDPWDSGQLGFIYATEEDIRNMLGVRKVTERVKNAVRERLDGEIKQYNQYLTGDVYGYKVTNIRTGDEVDSVWGFYGIEQAKEEAESSARFDKKNPKSLRGQASLQQFGFNNPK
jgi:hypothetical protein